MKRYLSTLLLTAIYVAPAFSESYEPSSAIYVTAGGGVSWLEHSDFYPSSTTPTDFLALKTPSTSDNVVGSINAALGYQFETLALRAEVAYRWLSNADYDWEPLLSLNQGPGIPNGYGTIEAQAVLLSLYYDFYTGGGPLTPFIGAGIGSSFNRTSLKLQGSGGTGATQDHSNSEFAWATSVGLKYEITPNWLVDVRGEYLSLGKTQLNELFAAGQTGAIQTNNLYAFSVLLNLTYAYNFL
jgi:opacity protein-like surface antigen